MLRKNSQVIAIVVVSIFMFSKIVMATTAEEKISGYAIVQGDLINPVGKESFFSEDVNLYFTKGGKLGVGIDTNIVWENDYLKVKPFATLLVGNNLNLIGGFSSDSSDNYHAFGGFSYFKSFGKGNSIFVAPYIYLGVSEESTDFFDFFAEAKHDLGNNFAVALEVIYDYYPDCGNVWALTGPALHYKASKNLDVFARVASETDLSDWNAFDVRIGLNWSF